MPRWLPVSWAHVGFSAANLWRRLNLGDRVFLVGVILAGLAIVIGFGVRLSGFLASTFRDWLLVGTAAYVFCLVLVSVNLPMMAVRVHRFNRYMPETSSRRNARIGLEFGVCILASALAAFMLVWPLPQIQHRPVFLASALIAIGAQAIWHIAQFVSGQFPAVLAQQSQTAGTSLRSRIWADALTGQLGERLPATSSRFLLKAMTNPFVWTILALMTLVTGGAIISAQNPLLLTLSLLSTLLLIAQFALMEPRVGNSVVLGVHSVRAPISRGVSDLCALMVPHLCLMAVGAALLILAQNWPGLYVAIAQVAVTVWALWLGLVIKALPPRATTKHALWAIIGGMIAGQVFPPLIVVFALAITIALTRDLIELTHKEPALWPRP
jgi:hypothetical protein